MECVKSSLTGRKAPTEKFGLEFIRSYRKMQKLEETLYYLRWRNETMYVRLDNIKTKCNQLKLHS